MADIPFLGCKISLISKCDIRYEGILYCVDAKESTIALSKVKSHGTENRADPSCFVAPKNEIYDVIVFRASDVKDLRVDAPEPPGLSDPAIISASTASTSFKIPTNEVSPPAASNQQPLQPRQQQQQQQQSQPRQQPQQQQLQPRQQQHQQSQPRQQQQLQQQLQPRQQQQKLQPRQQQLLQPRHQQQQQQIQPRQQQQQQHQQLQPRQQQQQQLQPRQQHHQGRSSRGGHKGGPPNYRRGPPPGGRRGRSGDRSGAPRGPRKGDPLKFEGEYDFDKANQIFLKLEGKLKKMTLKDDDKDGNESSGDGPPTGQSESGSGYDSEDQKDGASVGCDFYDRTKSFFDNISCEASERSLGKVNKPDWRKERQLNTETFGVSANYRRGGYRGRVYGANGYHRR